MVLEQRQSVVSVTVSEASLISNNGGAAKLLAPAIVLDSLTWSRDGTQILLREPRDSRSPRWSQASDTIAYLEPTMETQQDASSVPVSRFALKFVDGEGHPLNPNVPQQGLSNGLVAWAPDGRRVAVTTVPANIPGAIWFVEPGARTPFCIARNRTLVRSTSRRRFVARCCQE